VIDIHAHILPGLDDGPRDIKESIQICELAYEQGIDTIVATPHIGRYDNDKNKIVGALSQLNDKKPTSLSNLKLYYGSDTLFLESLPSQIKEGDIVTINDTGKYLLLEFPHDHIPNTAKDVVFRMLALGTIPIITHPERNKKIQKNPKLLFEFISQGALSQLTAFSLVGGFGRHVERLTYLILKNNLAHVIATDIHSVKGRSINLKPAVDVASQFIGEDLSLSMVTTIPKRIIEGESIDFPEPTCP